MTKNRYILLFIALVISAIIFIVFTQREQPEQQLATVTTVEEAAKEAKLWIENSAPTYLFDGSDLAMLDVKTLECSKCFSAIFTFKSSHFGYGNRTNIPTIQADTTHIIEIKFKDGRLDAAITDGDYDEINQKSLTEKPLMSVNIFFGNTKLNPNTNDCAKVFAVERITELLNPPYESTLELLLQGPSEKEKENGYFSLINQEVKINKFTLVGNIAQVDFSSEIEKNSGGSCRVIAERSQITETLKQFPTIKSVIISVDGKIDSALQP